MERGAACLNKSQEYLELLICPASSKQGSENSHKSPLYKFLFTFLKTNLALLHSFWQW